MKKSQTYLFCIPLVYISFVNAQSTYKIPPTSSSSTNVPVISDEEMEECVELYNQGEWLGKKLANQVVDSYSQESVDTYNKEVKKHSSLVNKFNRECAGKQSRSACKAAQKLNKEKGLPEYSC